MRKFWRGMAIFFLGGVLGTDFGVALGFFFFPFVFPPPPAMEQLTTADVATSAPMVAPRQAAAVAVATGTFIHDNPSDPVHWGRGKFSVWCERFSVLISPADLTPTC